MSPRFRRTTFVTFLFLVVYLAFPFSNRYITNVERTHDVYEPKIARPVTTEGSKGLLEERKNAQQPLTTAISSAITPDSEAANDIPDNRPVTEEESGKERDALGLRSSAGKIYGSSLRLLHDVGKNTGLDAASLTPTKSRTSFSDARPFKYNPYPQYNSKPWNAAYKGTYAPCDGPNGKIPDLEVFSGRPETFSDTAIGSYVPLRIDNNLCFERKSRLGAYGYVEEEAAGASEARTSNLTVDWDSVNWGQLQNFCLEKNSNRYSQLEKEHHFVDQSDGHPRERQLVLDVPTQVGGPKAREHDLPKTELRRKSRTAILLRAFSGMKYSDNEKQIIRSLIAELSLRSGGEYQVYLLLQIKEDLPIWTDQAAHEKAIRDNVPVEFRDMTILWDDAIMREWYPSIPSEASTVHRAQWFSVQKFAQENPQFDFYWNWELDTRYTGHHYDLLEKLAAFAKKQPRKGLWERNERYFIPSSHFNDYDFKFRKTVEEHIGRDTVWGAVPVANVLPRGPKPPTNYEDDDYEWGVGEEADYISLAPIFNPVGTNWIIRDEVWGYGGPEDTPRRATTGTLARCSKKLLDLMHSENLDGNHVSSEMTAQTVALHHGLKAVYAPIPMFFDREWPTRSLEKWFNPCRNASGGCQESAFGWGKEGRFSGSTWYFRAVSPMRLYNNWMGWEDSGIGGPEWERDHGRACLPPLLLHPIKEVVKPPPGHSSRSDLPY